MHLRVCKWQEGLPLGDQHSHPESRVIGLCGGKGSRTSGFCFGSRCLCARELGSFLFLSRWSFRMLRAHSGVPSLAA